MTKGYVLGVESGASVVKVLLADLDGDEVGVAVESTPYEALHSGRSESDPIAAWCGVGKSIQAVLAEHGIDPGEILAVGVTVKGAADSVQRWASDGTLSRAYQISGNYSYSGNCGPITRRLIDHEPHVAARVEWASFPPAAIVHRLTGKIKLCSGDPRSPRVIRQRGCSEEILDLFRITSMRARSLIPRRVAKSRAMSRGPRWDRRAAIVAGGASAPGM